MFHRVSDNKDKCDDFNFPTVNLRFPSSNTTSVRHMPYKYIKLRLQISRAY